MEKKASSMFLKDFILSSLAIILAIVLILTGYAIGKVNTEKKVEKNEKSVQLNSNENKKKITKVNSEEFEFEIPDNLVYYSNDQGLTIKDKDNTWSANIGQINESYASYTNNVLEKFSNTFDVSNFKRDMYNSLEFTSFEATNPYSNTKYIVAYAKADNNYCFEIYVNDLVNNSFNYDVLSIIAPIIDSAVYVG